MNQEIQMQEQGDSAADAIAAIVLIAIFVTTCIFWVSGQQTPIPNKFFKSRMSLGFLRLFGVWDL